MNYYIDNNGVFENKDGSIEDSNTVTVLSSKEWSELSDFRTNNHIGTNSSKVQLCKVESYSSYLYGTFKYPITRESYDNIKFIFYILENKIIIIDDNNTISKVIDNISNRKYKNYNMEHFIYDMFTYFISNDFVYLENMEQVLAVIDEDILMGLLDDFNKKIVPIKRRILKLHRYYGQLIQLGDELLENDMGIFDDKNASIFKVFSSRSLRLQEEVNVLREYVSEVQDMYESQIGIHQNDIMKVLTIVTTIFLPLSLIAGWYGMNFYNMPELHYKYGYPIVIAVSILIVVFSMWYFKKKKFF